MAKNHYVSQLTIRRFSSMKDDITIFNMNEKKIMENMKSSKIFYKENIYSDEIEKKLNILLETPFANLIDKKIINKNVIRLSREELQLVKKFMLLESVRTLSVEEFHKVFSGFSGNVKHCWDINHKIGVELPDHLPYQNTLTDSPKEAYERALRVFVESSNVDQIGAHKDSTRELYTWGKVFFDCYLSFWDSSDEQEFILTDNGLTSEYEPSHIIFEGLSHSKLSYLLHAVKTQSNEDKFIYSNLLSKMFVLYENFNIFNLTSTRCIVAINPFFRLYSKKGFTLMVSPDKPLNLKKPDVWPSFIKAQKAFEVSKNIYKHKGVYSMDDIFEYIPFKLPLIDTIYLNSLFLSQTQNLFGFTSFEKVKDSLYAFMTLRIFSNTDIYSNNYLSNLSSLSKHMINDEFNYIWDYFKEKQNIKPTFNTFDFLKHYGDMAINDTRNNIYALEFLLADKEKVRTMSNFDFMGTPDDRIKLIQKDIRRLREKNKV